MRLVDVHVEGETTLDVVLHPRLTVLTGMQAETHLLADALARCFVMAGNGVTGTVEYSGFHMPLDQTTVVSLDVQGDGFRVLTQSQVPEPDQAGAEVAAADLEERRIGWQRRFEAADAQRASLQTRLEATAAAVRVGQDELAGAQRAARELEATAQAAEDRPAELAERVAAVQAELDSADAHLSAGTQFAPRFAAAFDPEGDAIASIRIGSDPAMHRNLVGQATDMALLAPARLADLEGWLDAVASGEAAPNPALAAMLEEIKALESRWQEVSSVGVENEPAVVEARGRLEALSQRLYALEELAESGILADRARTEIDAAHNETVRRESERHVRSSGVEEAAGHEADVLATYGFDSYLDYTIALSTRSVGDAVKGTLDRVRTERVGAADALEAVRAEAAARRDELSEERRQLRERIRVRTGLAAEELTVDVLATVPELPSWLGVLAAELDASLGSYRENRARILSSLETLEGEQLDDVDRPTRLRLEAEQQHKRAVALAPLVDQAAREHDVVGGQMAEVDRTMEEATERLHAVDRQLAALAMPEADGYAPADVAAIVTGLTPLIDPPGPDPVPVLMVDTYAQLGSLTASALESTLVAAVRVQLVYITDEPTVLEWAEQLSPSAGQLVRLGKPNWFQRRLSRRARHHVDEPVEH
ncbi:MAG: hypothetical protein ACR2OH_06455 [Microthrixaceae bacterium]